MITPPINARYVKGTCFCHQDVAMILTRLVSAKEVTNATTASFTAFERMELRLTQTQGISLHADHTKSLQPTEMGQN